MRIYDVRQTGGSIEPILALKSRTSVNSLSWSQNGHLLAGGCESGVTYLWDIRHPNKEMMLFKTQEKNPVQVSILVTINLLNYYKFSYVTQVVNWCSWKPSVLLSGSSFPRPSVCLQSKFVLFGCLLFIK